MPLFLKRTLRNCLLAVAGAVMPGLTGTAPAHAADSFEPERKRMVDEIAALTRETRHETGRASIAYRIATPFFRTRNHAHKPAHQQ